MPESIVRSAFSEASQRVLLHAGCGGFLVPGGSLTCAKCHRGIDSPSEITGHPPIERESTRSLGWARIQEGEEL
jgi:hypothetical protein